MKCGVEESTHYDNICSQIGAKILRLALLAQDDKLGRLSDKLKFENPGPSRILVKGEFLHKKNSCGKNYDGRKNWNWVHFCRIRLC